MKKVAKSGKKMSVKAAVTGKKKAATKKRKEIGRDRENL